jgi:hypothetical protein
MVKLIAEKCELTAAAITASKPTIIVSMLHSITIWQPSDLE